MKKGKVVTLSAAKVKLWRIFSRFIRYRDCLKTTGTLETCRCITCLRVYDFKSIQSGHFIGGRNNAVLFNERMVNGQCFYCNLTLKGNILVYRRKIIEMYGPGADERMEAEAKITKQYKLYEILEMQAAYKVKIVQMGGNLK